MKRAMISVAAAMVLLFFGTVDVLTGQSGKKQTGEKTKSGRSRIVIEFVSFPGEYKKYEVYPWETLKVDDFQGAYAAMLEETKFEDWVRSLSGTATGRNRMIRAMGRQFVLVVCCKPHMCDSSQVIVLFDPVRKNTFSVLAVDGKFSWFGKPPEQIKDLLNVLLVEEFRAIYRGRN